MNSYNMAKTNKGSCTVCSVAACNNTRKKTTNISYHRFPKDPNVNTQWIHRCRRDPSFDTKSKYVCSEHFTEEDFEVDMRNLIMGYPQKKRLKPGVIPSQNLGIRTLQLPACASKRKERIKKREDKKYISLVSKIDDASILKKDGVMIVHECKNYDILGPTISYHKFPKEPSLRNKWIYACKRPKPFNVEAGHVCSLHFTVDDYERDLQAELTGQKRRKRLKQFVVPHMLLPTDDCKAAEGKEEGRKDETANKTNIHDPVKENSIQTVWVLQGQLLEEDKMKNNVNQSKTKKYLSPSFTIEKTCRTCLCYDKMIALSECVSNSKTTLKEVLLKFGNMMVSNKDYLPENICLSCAKRTEDMYHFQEQCKRAEQKLREFFKCPLQRADETLTPTPYLAYELLELDIKPEVESISVADNSEDLLADIKEEDMPVLNGESRKRKCGSLTVLKKHLKAPTHKSDPLSVMDKKKFECNICKKLFSTKSGLARHCGLLHKTPYTCKMCERCLPNKKLYNMHIKQYHRKADELSRGHRCDTCGKLYKILLNLQIHQRTCQTDEISFDCPHCDLKYAKLRLLATHIRMTHPTEKPYVCYVCKKGFVAVSNVYVHLRSHVRDKQYNCTMCDKLFFNENNLEIHMKRNHSGESHKCTQCSKSFTHPRKLTIHMRTHIAYNDMRFKCKFCPKRFNQSHHLQNHERVHTGQRPFLCTVCGKGFAQSYGLTVHMRYHSGVRPHVCQHCGKSFTQPQSLNMHVLTHTGEKQHMCSCCGKRFSVISSLRKHMTVHAEGDEDTEKRTRTKNKDENSKKAYRIRDIPYSYDQNTTCKVCQTTFASNTSLQAHMRKHIYQFVCKICKRGYSLSSSLEAHLRTHSGGTRQYFCSEQDCNAVFNRPDHLKYHFRRSHSKEKPYVCLECDKGFYQSGDLKVHMRRHTGEKPYGCKFCQKRFVAGSALTVHERTHTGERPYACSLCAHKCLSSSALASHMNSHTSKEVQNITSSTSEDKSQM